MEIISKQVICIRKDLNMRKGKMVAQGSHASLAAILNLAKGTGLGRSDWILIPVDEDLRSWLTDKFTKICVSCNSEEELMELYNNAEGLPRSLITDAGLTEFHGIPTKTCIAIGPAKEEEIDKITGHLPLL